MFESISSETFITFMLKSDMIRENYCDIILQLRCLRTHLFECSTLKLYTEHT